jgi:hypothetical protein
MAARQLKIRHDTPPLFLADFLTQADAKIILDHAEAWMLAPRKSEGQDLWVLEDSFGHQYRYEHRIYPNTMKMHFHCNRG